MIELAYPLWLLLLPVPFALRLLPAFRHSRDSVKVPFFARLLELSEEAPRTGSVILTRSRVQVALVGFTWVCLVLAAAKPEAVLLPKVNSKADVEDLARRLDARPETAHMFIVNPLSGKGFIAMFSTHPPVEERIARLRAMRIA